MDLDALTVTTTNGKKFTGLQHARMAYLVYQRFGEDMSAAAEAWRRLLQNNCEDWRFEELVGSWIDYSLDQVEKAIRDEY